ncbi:MAG: RNA polymerase sigma factor [Chitinophagaceae bacterium]|nr:RNA polymerase sigma factor [Chitinophagaceae bacterium]
MTDANLIHDCMKGDRQAQSVLYAMFIPKMFVVCLRFSKNRQEAEDILQEGFVKVFQFLPQFNYQGSLESWIRKIMVNCALQRIKSNNRLAPVVSIDSYREQLTFDDDMEGYISSRELLKLVMSLPPGYKAVFNLYVFEGYKHREIAEILGITEGTSKSNLSDARTYLKKQLRKMNISATY